MRVARILEFMRSVYHSSPAIWVLEFRRRFLGYDALPAVITATPPPTPPSLAKAPVTGKASPAKAPLARRLDANYFARRDPLAQSLIERVRAGEELYEVLKGFNARDYEERLVEYPYFANWLMKLEKGLDLLDVGCVMNNKLVSGILKDRCNNVCLSNVAREPVVFALNPVSYHLAPLDYAFPGGEEFPLVTCFSTIEHIGYDNSQYGCKDPAKYTTPNIEPLVAAFKKLARLTAPGGSLLLSVPYGYREAVVHPVTFKVASQIFDYDSMKEGLEALESEGVSGELEVLTAKGYGWERTEPSTCRERYADGCPAAGAVAMVKGTKRK